MITNLDVAKFCQDRGFRYLGDPPTMPKRDQLKKLIEWKRILGEKHLAVCAFVEALLLVGSSGTVYLRTLDGLFRVLGPQSSAEEYFTGVKRFHQAPIVNLNHKMEQSQAKFDEWLASL
jgi:hypothetical protein